MAKKKKDDDNGTSFIDMDATRNNVNEDKLEHIKEIQNLNLTRKEKIAMFFGIMKGVIPALLCVIAGFAVVIFLVAQWLK